MRRSTVLTTTSDDSRVAVVGAGPVGLTAALLLAARGVSVALIERRDGPSAEPKAISIDDEALRAYQRAGVLRAVLPIVSPGTGTMYYDAEGRPLFHGGTDRPGRLGYPYKNPFAQPELERVLHRAAHDHPLIHFALGTAVEAIDQRADGVVLTLIGPGGTRTDEADFVIGADGGRSTIRAATGIAMVGRRHDEAWLVIDTLGDPHHERYGMHFGTPGRPAVIVPGLDGRCRYEFRLFADEGAAGDEPSFELIQRLLSPHRSIRPEQVERATIYRFNGLNAATYRHGRLFLMGDAAHMMPPFAGQGLNSGIRDAVNLSWKIGDVLAGRMPSQALDSYTAERRPQAGAVVAASERLGRIVMTTSARVAGWRDRLVRDALRTAEGRDFFEHMRYRPANRFDVGLLVPGPETGAPFGQPRVLPVGGDAVVLLDEALGDGWALLGVETAPDEWEQVAGIAAAADAVCAHVPLDDRIPRLDPGVRVLTDIDGALETESGPYRGRFVLLRPDRVVAAVFAADEQDAVRRAIADWFTGEGVLAPPASPTADIAV